MEKDKIKRADALMKGAKAVIKDSTLDFKDKVNTAQEILKAKKEVEDGEAQ